MCLIKKIDDHLLQKQLEKSKRQRSGLWSPSSFGQCLRRQVWNRKNEPITNPPDARSLRVFACGVLFHDFVQDMLPPHETEVKCLLDDVMGFADVVTEDTVYDIKSQHSKGFFYMKSSTYDVKKEKKNNWLQLAFYGMSLKKPKLHLVVISKDDLCINEYEDLTEKWIEPLNEELTMLRTLWKNNIIPEASPRLYNGKECQYCQFLDKCKEVENGLR